VSIATDTAAEFLRVAAKAAEREDVREALYHMDRASELLLRQPVEIESPGTVVGESVRYGHLGKVLAEKAKLRLSR
jgi:hypothetical protein